MLITRDFLQHVDMTKAFVKGVRCVLASEDDLSSAQAQSFTRTALTDLYEGLSVAVEHVLIAGNQCDFSQVLAYLMDSPLWQGLASCLACIPSESLLQVCEKYAIHLGTCQYTLEPGSTRLLQ